MQHVLLETFVNITFIVGGCSLVVERLANQVTLTIRFTRFDNSVLAYNETTQTSSVGSVSLDEVRLRVRPP